MPYLKLISKADQGAAYFIISKAANNSVLRTFFHSEEERRAADKYALQSSFKSGRKGVKAYSREPEYANFIYCRNFLLPRFRKIIPDSFDFASLQGLFYDEEQKTWMVAGTATGAATANKGYQCLPISLEEINSWFIFTFVRNPFSRLVSTFQNKMIYDKREKIFLPVKLPDVYQCSSFSHFIQIAARMEDKKIDEHIAQQVYLLNEAASLGIDIKFAGKVENIQDEFEPLRKKYNLLPLERVNDSSFSFNVHHNNWRDYYTPETATIVYLRYKADFEQLGYAESYSALMDYLETRPASFARKQVKRRWLGRLGLSTYKKYLSERH